MSVELKTIVEGLLFVADAPLSVPQLADILETEDRQAIKDALIALAGELDEMDRAFTLVEVAGGWRFRTKSDLSFWLRKFKKQAVTRLSPAALETLSIVAYKQPVLKTTIQQLRGVDVGGVLRMLMEKDLVRVMGREDLPGKPLIYGTTRRFLEVFDLNSIKDLPTLDEIDGLMQDAANTGPIEKSAQQSLAWNETGTKPERRDIEDYDIDQSLFEDPEHPEPAPGGNNDRPAGPGMDAEPPQDAGSVVSPDHDGEPQPAATQAPSPLPARESSQDDNPWPPSGRETGAQPYDDDDDTPTAA